MTGAILLAAGNGERAGFEKNKVLMPLNGLPVLAHSLSAFAFLDEIIVACRERDKNVVEGLLAPYPNARAVIGGETRFFSAYLALKEAKSEIILLHDAARPFVTRDTIMRCLECVRQNGSAVAALPATDTTVLSHDGKSVSRSLTRREVFSVQTPQGFYTKDILRAYECALSGGREAEFTDDGSVYGEYIAPPVLFAGERSNRKLTYADDFEPVRVGFGADTHRFEGSEDAALPFLGFIVLGGEKIPCERRLVAHSDGDVLTHALMDALLSAAGLRDIGYYFPDSDERYAGADSLVLLHTVVNLVREAGFTAQNASICILAEKPRLSPHIEAMRKNIARALSLPPSAVGIAAGTNEGLGYIGEGRGITCYAYVSCRTVLAD